MVVHRTLGLDFALLLNVANHRDTTGNRPNVIINWRVANLRPERLTILALEELLTLGNHLPLAQNATDW